MASARPRRHVRRASDVRTRPAYAITRACAVAALAALAVAAVPTSHTPLPTSLAAAAEPATGPAAAPAATDLPPPVDPEPTPTATPPPGPTPTAAPPPPSPAGSPRPSRTSSPPRPPQTPARTADRPVAPGSGVLTGAGSAGTGANRASASPTTTAAPEKVTPQPGVTGSQGPLPTFASVAAEADEPTHPWLTRALVVVSVLVVLGALVVATTSLRRRLDDPRPEDGPVALG